VRQRQNELVSCVRHDAGALGRAAREVLKLGEGGVKYATVCSGAEAPTLAWKSLGWKAAWFSEIKKSACALIKHHYPETPNLGDMKNVVNSEVAKNETVRLILGGTPCQSFSVAGLRKGLDDPRGNLALVFLSIVDRLRPEWVVWENVPGVLSSNKGKDFGAFLGALVELGYGFAYRSLDAQYFGLAQRRERVFVVAHSRGWQAPAAVLFEPESLSGHPAPIRGEGSTVANTLTTGIARSGGATAGNNPGLVNGVLTEELSRCLTSRNARHDAEIETFVVDSNDIVGTLTAAHDASPTGSGGFPIVPLAFRGRDGGAMAEVGTEEISFCLRASRGGGDKAYIIAPLAIAENQRGEVRTSDVTPCLGGLVGKAGQGYQAAQTNLGVRKLTPLEWERLMGIPDGYTLVPFRGKPMKDGPRYDLIGNSIAVPVLEWIGSRIDFVDAIIQKANP